MPESNTTVEPKDCKQARERWNAFLTRTIELRPELFRFCRSLTNNPWDAEDLVQETLLKAYGRLADRHGGIEDLRRYLFRMASNQWIDWCRRAGLTLVPTGTPEPKPFIMGNYYELQHGISQLLHFLPPKERAAFVLKEAFKCSLAEIAEILETTTGAVKSALHRARQKIEASNNNAVEVVPQSLAQQEVVEQLVEAFNSRDLDAIADLFVDKAAGNCYGCFLELSSDEIKSGSMFYTINTPDGKPIPAPYAAECRVLNGDVLFLVWKNEKQLDDVFRLTTSDSKISRFTSYYCCPDVLNEVASLVGASASDHGYYYEQKHGSGAF